MDATFEELKNENVSTNNYVNPSYHYAGFWMRFWAYLLDLIVISSVIRLFINPIFHLLDLEKNTFMFSGYSVISAMIFFSYFIFMTKFFGQTLGKMVFGLRVISLQSDRLSWMDVLFRELIGRYISKTIWGLLYLVVAFTKKKQGIHDLFVSTTVIHEER
ncbi:RDD family protein [Bacillus sp. FJAT-47783]|uniref:RDD family protein n=1 Tax=Bacillus sp. FJAT-47783 TaxID=2922712 RepID=UPI001FAD076C